MVRIPNQRLPMFALGMLLGASLLPLAARGEKRAVDLTHSLIKVHVYKAGLFSGFGHDHEIEAPLAEGEVEDSASPAVELRVDTAKLLVLDPELPQEKRTEVQQTMQGPQVLDSRSYPEIRFRSTAVEQRGADHWTVRGDLTLHGQTHPVNVDVLRKDRAYSGSVTLKQRDFGMTPVRVAGGTVKVKDEVKVEFEIVLAK